MQPSFRITLLTAFLVLSRTLPADAEVSLPNIFTDHMVLQRNQKDRVWGWAEPGEKITVTIQDQSHPATADDDGNWIVMLDPMKAGGPFDLVAKCEHNTVTIKDVLIGEVWICSGQSNMRWTVSNSNDPDIEILTANYPKIRLITIPNVGTQEPQKNFPGKWEVCSPQTVPGFSGVGYYFGRQLYQTLKVPVGLINNAWGGSACEAWINRELLENDDRFEPLMKHWNEIEANYDEVKVAAAYKMQLEKWRERYAAARNAGQPLPNRPRPPRNPLRGNQRPANIYNGVLKPTIGYGIRGVIWYQGESNASRAYQYRDLFPLMIQSWRDEWKQGAFPFYWVQLADYRDEKPEPGDSDWAELREAQTMTMKLPNTGQAVITDLGESHDIHPRNKQDVAKRLARWALAKDYGYDIAYRSPEYQSMEQQDDKIELTFDHVGKGLDTFDVRTPIGFTIAGEDQKFVNAKAKIIGKDKIVVWSDAVSNPVAVRYAWADNPICNVQSADGLKLTPFRTDDWPGITKDKQTR